MTAPATTSPPTVDETVGMDRAAFDRTASIRALIKVEESPPFNLHVMYAVGTGLAIAARLADWRDAMLTLPGFDISHLDNFADYARATQFVHVEIVRRVERMNQLPGLAKEGFDLRDLLLTYAETLSKKKLISPKVIADVKDGTGYRDMALDLIVLVRELEALPASYTSPESVVTRADMARALEVAEQVNTTVGTDASIDMSQSALVDERRKLAFLLLRSHGQLRRAMSYLRYDQGDANELVPSLYPAGPGRPKAAKAEPEPDLAAVHQHLHEHMPAPLDPEDNPFAPEE